MAETLLGLVISLFKQREEKGSILGSLNLYFTMIGVHYFVLSTLDGQDNSGGVITEVRLSP
jgi:hypothetical protein